MRKYLSTFIAGLLGSVCSVLAAGVVSIPDDASLRSAVAGGGLVTFNCDGTIALSNSIAITNDTTLDASGHSITISGNSLVRLFTVVSNVTFNLQDLVLANGMARGTNGAPGAPGGGSGTQGGSGEGGAIYNGGGIINALNCSFLNNKAEGGVGGSGVVCCANGKGGEASGGAIYTQLGGLNATNCVFAMNSSLGGTGAVTSLNLVVSEGGDARGGAIFQQGGTLQLVNCSIVGNRAVGGLGRRFNVLGIASGGVASGGACIIAGGDSSFARCTISGNSSFSGATRSTFGGAIYLSSGYVQLNECLVSSNTVTAGVTIGTGGAPGYFPGASAFGGAAYNADGILWITNSTLSDNQVFAGNGGPSSPYSSAGTASGGAVCNHAGLHVDNSTIARNLAHGGSAFATFYPNGSALGGGLDNSGSMTVDYVTVAGNSAVKTSGGTVGSGTAIAGIFSTNGSGTIHCTIVADSPSGSNYLGTALTDNGFNLCSDSSANFTGPGSLNNTDPKLGPLVNYGGPTPTMVLLAGSPAIDGGDNTDCLATDQRGHLRPYGSACDIGAFESSPPFLIRGLISGSTLFDEVSVTNSASFTTTVAGHYSLESPPGTYTVTPGHSNYLFLPNAQVVTVGPDRFNVDFKAYHWNALSIEDTTTNTFHQIFAGSNGVTYRLLVSSNLAEWTPIATNVIGPSQYLELFDPMNRPRRFYRMVSP